METADSLRGLHYRQVFKNNMSEFTEPEITNQKIGNKKDFTCISFYPDLSKFGMAELDRDIVALLTKRAYDMAGVTDSRVRVYLNGKRIGVNDFSGYVDLYLQNEEHKELPKIAEKKHQRWEVYCSLSDGQFQQVSFVNGICTSRGGTHVNYITDQIV